MDRLEPGMEILYFAYGSCMSTRSFRRTVPQFERIGAARLDDHVLAFTYDSATREGGVADIVYSPGKSVWGVLFRFDAQYLPRLDTREGVDLGRYRRKWVAVQAGETRHAPVLTYTVVEKEEEEIPPNPEYAGLILEGALESLDDEYILWLERRFEALHVEPSLRPRGR